MQRKGEVLDFAGLSRALAAGVETGVVPLLVLRWPAFSQVAWQHGRRSARALERRTVTAFFTAARRIVRDGDLLAHDLASDRFAVAMLGPARAGRPPGSREIRSALERIAAAMSLATGDQMETGWWRLETAAEAAGLGVTMSGALERGRRERERHMMLAAVGHELRTPLTSIRGYIETVLDDRRLDEPTHRRFLETARQQALRLGRLVDGMLEFSMLDLSTNEPRAASDVVQQIHAAVDMMLPLAQERDVSIEVRCQPGMAMARIDADGCFHAVLNLLENAVKYGREGGSVLLSCDCGGEYVTVRVEDDGPGVEPADLECIFAMGFRSHAGDHPGKGIGLALVRLIAERAGGSVHASASPLGGASFLLTLSAAT